MFIYPSIITKGTVIYTIFYFTTKIIYSNVQFKEASKKVQQQKIESVQKVRPSSAQQQEKFKPSWNDKVESNPKQFDNLKKNEIFKIENKLQKEKLKEKRRIKKIIRKSTSCCSQIIYNYKRY
ncbi:unnamed protein product (macronuclear) [Paramecium tetraurelia]|uniref:Transmembrane protein n=1 Tax=Paramecium tetraurelia TaxID=5888 RepID=A0CD37_PARTE|nr:uncharacterized protein GSPATT00037489001 [Paramecium tetraurelia]CAK68704.1 unnamed protein product [Paramecium tetraurelia]|eukprot:XP_001436101.1 hypothetical protein (macronuclear) [Paramecium tetraurelia strain d4-2]